MRFKWFRERERERERLYIYFMFAAWILPTYWLSYLLLFCDADLWLTDFWPSNTAFIVRRRVLLLGVVLSLKIIKQITCSVVQIIFINQSIETWGYFYQRCTHFSIDDDIHIDFLGLLQPDIILITSSLTTRLFSWINRSECTSIFRLRYYGLFNTNQLFIYHIKLIVIYLMALRRSIRSTIYMQS